MVNQQAFIEFSLQHELLQLGSFTLKSGRTSPYFFNLGRVNSGAALAQLGAFYAQAFLDQPMLNSIDVLFGPAYKGIPIVTAMATALAEHHQKDYAFAFNRKEQKQHGEGGVLVGTTDLQGKRVLIVDDVMTAGTAVRESYTLLQSQGAQVAGVMVALDRQEKGQSQLSAVQEVEQTYGVPVVSLMDLTALVDFIAAHPSYQKYLSEMQVYQKTYGVFL